MVMYFINSTKFSYLDKLMLGSDPRIFREGFSEVFKSRLNFTKFLRNLMYVDLGKNYSSMNKGYMHKVGGYSVVFFKDYFDKSFYVDSFIHIQLKYNYLTLERYFFHKFLHYKFVRNLKNFLLDGVVFWGKL